MILEAVFRHNFIYIYPAGRDSGGNMWAVFLQFTLAAMFTAQLTSKTTNVVSNTIINPCEQV